MEIITSNTTTTTTAPSSNTVKNLEGEAETQTPIRIQPAKPLAFSNGVLKRHNSLQNHHGFTNNYYNNHHHHHPVVVTYKECLKNHAASLGSHAVDGCGEFMPSPTANPTDPTSLKCAACGCHRNFHRREPEETLALPPPPPNITPALEYQPHHRHHPPPPPPPPHRSGDHSSPNSPSPPPISSAYYPASAPHMLLALSAGLGQPSPNSNPEHNHNPLISPISVQTNPNGRKRHRTKFTQSQKDEMLEFAEKVGWKMQKRDEDLTSDFCSRIGIEKGVLKVWMHNNKNTFGKKDVTATAAATATATATTTNNHNGNANGNISFGFMSRNNTNETNTATGFHIHHHHHERSNDIDKDLNHSHNHSHSHSHSHGHDHSHQLSAQVTTNGSSSSN